MNNFLETLLDFRDDTLDFIDNHKKGLIIGSIVVIVLVTAIIAAIVLLQPVKIIISNADQEVGNIIGTRTDVLEFTAVAQKNGKNINTSIDWEVSSGKLEITEEGNAKWELPTDEGTYGITAKSGDIASTKYITIIGNELSQQYRISDYKILVQDTDGDGLTDIYEGSNSKTSQTNVDTDGDGLNDGDEIIFELDPLNADSKGDGVKDGDRRLEYTFKSGNITMDMTGKGNFTQTTIDKYTTETVDNVSSVIDGVYSFYTEVQLESAKITIAYDRSKITGSINESTLAVYELDEDNNAFKKLNTTRNEDNTLTFTIEGEKLGKYFIADSSKLTSNLSTDLVFLIDNSGSMYSSSEVSDSEENDVDFKRVDVVNDLIDKLEGNYRFGVAKFTFEYKELIRLTSDKTSVKNRVLSIKTDPENFTGTYIGAAIEGGLKQFSDNADQNRRYIILLSDGADTSSVSGYNSRLLEEQLVVAKQKGVKIYTVGLGSVINERDLKNIASKTDGKYYFASTSEDLDIVFKAISADLNYNLYDTNNDDENDSVVLADSGFLVGRNGFNFSNFSNTQVEYGYGYGMVLYAKLFYEGNIPSSLGAKTITTTDGTVINAPPAKPNDIGKIEGKSLRTYKPITLTVLSDLPANFWNSSVTNGALAIRQNYKAELQKLGFTTYAAKYNNEHSSFNRYESIRFDMSNYLDVEAPKNVPLEGNDIELLRTLARFDIVKYRDEKYYFYDNNDTAFNRLKEQLSQGVPTMIRINDDYTVLGVKLLADSKNMNKYKIEVYDPNYAGIPKYIEVDRYKFSDIDEISKVITDEYEYKFKYLGVDVGICISIPNIVENM